MDDASTISSGSSESSGNYADHDINENKYDQVLQRWSIFSKNQVNYKVKNQVNYSEFRQYLNGIMSLKQKANNEVLEFSYEDKLLEIYGKIFKF